MNNEDNPSFSGFGDDKLPSNLDASQLGLVVDVFRGLDDLDGVDWANKLRQSTIGAIGIVETPEPIDEEVIDFWDNPVEIAIQHRIKEIKDKYLTNNPSFDFGAYNDRLERALDPDASIAVNDENKHVLDLELEHIIMKLEPSIAGDAMKGLPYRSPSKPKGLAEEIVLNIELDLSFRYGEEAAVLLQILEMIL